MKSYIHKEMRTDIRSIFSYYKYLGEIQLDAGGRRVLCTEGFDIIDRACCGTGGCYFGEVAEHIVSWKNGIDKNDHAISVDGSLQYRLACSALVWDSPSIIRGLCFFEQKIESLQTESGFVNHYGDFKMDGIIEGNKQ
jgi:hypothetical protein